MNYYLLYHAESESLFWSDEKPTGESFDSALCVELGDSNSPTREQAQFIYEMQRVEGRPPFDNVFKVSVLTAEKPEPKPEPIPKGKIFEAKPRWPGAPPVCLKTNMLAFDSAKDIAKFQAENAPGCHTDSIVECDFCHKFHWSNHLRAPSGESSGTGRNAKIYQLERDNGTKRLG